MRIGNTAINNYRLGNSQVNRIYLGDTIIYTGTYVTDNFTASDGTNILSYISAEHGYSWVNQPFNNTTNPAVFINGRVRGAGSNNVYYLNYLMPIINYEVEGVFRVFTNTGIAGVTARASSSGNTYYIWRYRDSIAGWELLKRVSNVQTTLATFSRISTGGETITATIRCNGSTITGLINGVERVVVTDTDITTAGRAGLSLQWAVSDTTGLHCDSFIIRGV